MSIRHKPRARRRFITRRRIIFMGGMVVWILRGSVHQVSIQLKILMWIVLVVVVFLLLAFRILCRA